MAVVVEIADDWHVEPAIAQTRDDFWHRASCGLVVYRNTYELRASSSERSDLIGRRYRVCSVGVRHRLNDNRVLRPDLHTANRRCYRIPSSSKRHAVSHRLNLVETYLSKASELP